MCSITPFRCLSRSPNLESLEWHLSCNTPDCTATKNKGGAGFVIYLSSSHSIHFSLGCGRCTNTKAKMLALWALLTVSMIMGIPLHTIFGDSLVIISWASGKISLNLPHLKHWVMILEIIFKNFQNWSWNRYSVSITRLLTFYQKMLSYLIQVMGLLKRFWMEILLVMETFSYSRCAVLSFLALAL